MERQEFPWIGAHFGGLIYWYSYFEVNFVNINPCGRTHLCPPHHSHLPLSQATVMQEAGPGTLWLWASSESAWNSVFPTVKWGQSSCSAVPIGLLRGFEGASVNPCKRRGCWEVVSQFTSHTRHWALSGSPSLELASPELSYSLNMVSLHKKIFLNMNILWQAIPHPGICSTEIFTPNDAKDAHCGSENRVWICTCN